MSTSKGSQSRMSQLYGAAKAGQSRPASRVQQARDMIAEEKRLFRTTTEQRVANGETFKVGKVVYTSHKVLSTHRIGYAEIAEVQLDTGERIWVFVHNSASMSYSIVSKTDKKVLIE